MSHVSIGVQVVVYALVLVACLSAATGVAAIAARSAERLSGLRGAALALAIGLAVWLAASITVGQAELIAGLPQRPVSEFGVRSGTPLVIGALALILLEPLRRLLSNREVQPTLIGLMTYRLIGGIFLLALALNVLPAVFAVPAGVLDIVVGLSAIPVALALRGGQVGVAIAWNVLGLLDSTIAIVLGVAAGPGALRVINVDPTTAALTVLPLVLIPTFVVPFSMLLHVMILRALLAAPESETAKAYS
ncbi:MAG TPA: hypothetical protein VOB72_00160 [Candidatus Dormibacteraeota bacterium]|nr:hypothetical protein [Candidatus Dormibacteraeota bacterium]